MPQVGGLQATGGGPTGSPPAWWNFILGYDFNAVEPYGGFAKPDLNFGVPAGNNITALMPGTVTAIDGNSTPGFTGQLPLNTPAWGHVVTVKLDSPYSDTSGANAQSTAYLHLSNVNVSVGQHINGGDVLGFWSGQAPIGTQQADPGFALGNGSNYGVDPGNLWGYGFAPGKAPNTFNPDKLIQSIQGKPYYDIAQQVQTNSGQCGTLDIPCQLASLAGRIHDALVSFGEHIAVFVLALLLIVIGLVLMKDAGVVKVPELPGTGKGD